MKFFILAPREDPKIDEVGKENIKLSESLLAKLHPADQNRHKECSVDTTKFLQNVMKEILQCGTQKELNNFRASFLPEVMTNRSERNIVNCASKKPFQEVPQRNSFCTAPQDPNKFNARIIKRKVIQNDSVQSNKASELSFTFLRKQNSNRKEVVKNFVTDDKLPETFQRTFQKNESRLRNNTVYDSLMQIDESRFKTLGINDFNPQFASTPKKNDLHENSKYKILRSNNNTARSIQKSVRKHKIKRQLNKKKMAKRLERSKIDKENKHKSFSGRFFDAINTSCTILANTVKNIFRPKSDVHESENDTESLNATANRDTLSCSYSFTNYMRRRDFALKNDCTNISGGGLEDEALKSKASIEDFSMETSNSCNTCNNTIALKRKLVRDDNLKQTIRKLKLGINLYGCNFKVIFNRFIKLPLIKCHF